MKRVAGLAAIGMLAALGSAALAQQRAYSPGPHNIELPADWQQRFIRYTTVDRPDRKIIRNMYVNPEAFAALTAGQPLPYGTLAIMADQRARVDAQGNVLLDGNGRLIPEPAFIAIAAQQKERGWGEGYGPELRNGEWEYAVFNPQTGAWVDRPLNACFTCHLQARAQQDYSFTTWDYANRAR
ncbi:cytochrome P460 family protein [Roseomonas rosulenta]|uniref:cytochrome P460 family protein n=1 Tax=Roseomonas rosulenta TaxID=2748667 RepID=UPI0018DEFC89|nr:cytochrome P460 family protein [Roseomonas rosulenta]